MTKIKSILDAISSTIPEKDKLNVTENRGSHALASGINYINFLKENFSEDESQELIKRFLNAIRTEDPKKFYRGIEHIREQTDNSKETIIVETDKK